VIEAMAVGLPCLSTAVNGIPELLAENDMFEQKDVDGFVCRIEELISDNAEYQKVSGQNISKALEYENSVLEKRRKIFYARLMDLVYGLYSI
jgi:glycosyltransferase involved in cell wall biosynthesis